MWMFTDPHIESAHRDLLRKVFRTRMKQRTVGKPTVSVLRSGRVTSGLSVGYISRGADTGQNAEDAQVHAHAPPHVKTSGIVSPCTKFHDTNTSFDSRFICFLSELHTVAPTGLDLTICVSPC